MTEAIEGFTQCILARAYHDMAFVFVRCVVLSVRNDLNCVPLVFREVVRADVRCIRKSAHEHYCITEACLRIEGVEVLVSRLAAVAACAGGIASRLRPAKTGPKGALTLKEKMWARMH